MEQLNHGKRLLRTAIDEGVRVIDTAWYYGPDHVLSLIAKSLHPYPEDLVLVAKVGNSRVCETREYIPRVGSRALRAACNRTLRGLRIDAIPLLLLRWRADLYESEAFDDAWAEIVALQAVGKAKYIGLSNVALTEIVRAEQSGHVYAVSNAFSLLDQSDRHVLDDCIANGRWYLPYYPLHRGEGIAAPELSSVAAELGLSLPQLMLMWLLGRSSWIIPIPGTSDVRHLRENISLMIAPRPKEDWTLVDRLAKTLRVRTTFRGGAS